jgi:hypothetical protein
MLPNYKDFGQTTLYSGLIGSGMTLAATIHAYELKNLNPKLDIVSNSKLYGIDFKPFNIEDLIKNFDKFTDKIVILDNAYITLDNRSTQTRLNRYMAYLLAQSRTRNIKWVLTSPGYNKKDALHKIDKRWRRSITNHFRVHCYKNNKLNPPVRTLLLGKIRIPKVYNYFKYFNTLDIPINPGLGK